MKTKTKRLLFTRRFIRFVGDALLLLMSSLGVEPTARDARPRRDRPILFAPAPNANAIKNTTANSVYYCSSHDDFHFQSLVLLTFQGRPGKITTGDIVNLQQAMIAAYHKTSACNNVSGAGSAQLAQVNISRNEVDSYGSTISRIAESANNITQQFTVIAKIQGASCRGCQAAQRFHLFSTNTVSSSARERRSLKGKKSSKKTFQAANNRMRRKRKRPTNAPMSAIQVDCLCPVPSKSSFAKSMNSSVTALTGNATRLNVAFLSSSIDKLVNVTELESYSPCPSDVKNFQLFVTVDFTWWGLNYSIPKDLALKPQYHLLQQAILQSYNHINALNIGNVCDNFFLTVTDVQIAKAPQPIESNIIAFALAFDRIFVFNVTGTCRGCSANPPAFFSKNGGGSNRERSLCRPSNPSVDDMERGEPKTTQVVSLLDATTLESSSPDYHHHHHHHHRKLPVVSSGCYCPVGSTQFRRPNSTEFLNVLNDRLTLLEGAELISIVGLATIVQQDTPINCSAEVNYLQDTLEVPVNRSLLNTTINITSTAAYILSQSVLTAYNSEALKYCDQFFRSVDSVELVAITEEEEDSRKNQSGSRSSSIMMRQVLLRPILKLKFKMNGKCRGCPKSTPLFNDATHGRSSVHSTDNVFARASSSSSSSPVSFQQHHLRQYHEHDDQRRLILPMEKANNNSQTTFQCYCNAQSLGNQAPDRLAISAGSTRLITSQIGKIGQDLKQL